jgi:pSer/pThr/pTyr-binding forkhead associated (FHA) protein
VIIYGTDPAGRIPPGSLTLQRGRVMQQTVDVPLDDDAVELQVRFAWTGSSYIVRDLGSTKGTFVNDVNVRNAIDGDRDQDRPDDLQVHLRRQRRARVPMKRRTG